MEMPDLYWSHSQLSRAAISDSSDVGHVVTAKLPDSLFCRLDETAKRMDRSKSWIVRQALNGWLELEQRRHDAAVKQCEEVNERTASIGDGSSFSKVRLRA